MKHEFIKDIHYYLEGDKVIFTEAYHLQRGECCNNKCRHCPYKEKKNVGKAKENTKFNLENK